MTLFTRLLAFSLLTVYGLCALLFLTDCAGAVLGVLHA
jgi:hypothetical protein